MANTKYLIFINHNKNHAFYDMQIINAPENETAETITFVEIKILGCKDLYILTKLFKLSGLPAGKQHSFLLDATVKIFITSAMCFFAFRKLPTNKIAKSVSVLSVAEMSAFLIRRMQ